MYIYLYIIGAYLHAHPSVYARDTYILCMYGVTGADGNTYLILRTSVSMYMYTKINVDVH